MRDLLPLLRQNPQLYAKASQQALPTHMFDYLAINPAAYNATSAALLEAATEEETKNHKGNAVRLLARARFHDFSKACFL